MFNPQSRNLPKTSKFQLKQAQKQAARKSWKMRNSTGEQAQIRGKTGNTGCIADISWMFDKLSIFSASYS